MGRGRRGDQHDDGAEDRRGDAVSGAKVTARPYQPTSIVFDFAARQDPCGCLKARVANAFSCDAFHPLAAPELVARIRSDVVSASAARDGVPLVSVDDPDLVSPPGGANCVATFASFREVGSRHADQLVLATIP